MQLVHAWWEDAGAPHAHRKYARVSVCLPRGARQKRHQQQDPTAMSEPSAKSGKLCALLPPPWPRPVESQLVVFVVLQ